MRKIRGEEWRIIPSVAGYEVSSLGRVRKEYLRGYKEVPAHVGTGGHLVFNAKIEVGWFTTKRVARCVAEAFCPGFMPEMRVWLKDCNKKNCRVDNIELETMSTIMKKVLK